MSAARHINPNQLKMFMSAHEITASYQMGDGDRLVGMRGLEDDAALLTRKYREAGAHEGDFTKRIVREGVQNPIELNETPGRFGKPQVFNGHHRVAVGAFEDRHRLMPVIHHEDEESAMEYYPDTSKD